ncbi:ABC transporter B family member 21-like [Oryza brachyantha]|uniref:ABC transporter B family member 21-like n=1 Tax=Oryza brachyantha TaxID=4533 RepID=UPI0003EAA8E5|nr:ABC transporter B family member 21-like [Oryza brachyantha]
MEEASTAGAADEDKRGKEENDKRMDKDGKVAFHHLFKYADNTDVALMLVGTIASLASGMSQVIMTIIFGQMVDAFGKSSPSNILHQVNKAVLYFVYLGIGSGVVCFLQVSCWAITGERQATRIRSLYLKTILRQDMTFFDKEMTTGQVVSSISADTTLIQGAIGEKAGKFQQLVTTFLGGFVLAFLKGWLLTLVMLSTIPPFIFAAGIVSKMLAEVSSEGLASYRQAGDIVEQTVGSIRTVVSFNGEKKAIGLYNDLVKKAYKGAVKEGFIQGFGMGFLNLVYFSSFGLIVWYGSKLSLSKGYSGADIMNILFGIMIGASEKVNELTHFYIMYEEASQVATEAIGSIRTVASYCAEKKVMTKYNQKCQASRHQGIRTGIVGGIGFGFSYMMLFMTSALCYYIGAKFVSQGNSTFGDVFKAFFSLVVAMLGVSATAAMASDSSKAKDSASSIFEILDRKSQIDSSSNKGLTLELVKGDIEFMHISFRYPSRPDVLIFSDFTLSIPSGKTVALVGQSGSGKSTAIALLERFYDPDYGVILLDGVEIKKLEISWLRDQMGLVSQEPVLFNGTIRANIAYGKNEEVSEEEIVAAAQAANAHEFISSMPQGYSTGVGERGTQLSGGQKQRIAIARAILKDPRILLLDETTSALDAESESIVQEALDHVMIGRTTVVVAHRLSTIQGADIIAVLKDGEIEEKGKHEALMGIAGGAYASLVELHHKS